MKGSLEYSSQMAQHFPSFLSLPADDLSRPFASLSRFAFQQKISAALLGCSRFLIGTPLPADRCRYMSEPLQTLIQSSLQIAWDFLMRTGEIQDPDGASRFLLKTINDLT